MFRRPSTQISPITWSSKSATITVYIRIIPSFLFCMCSIWWLHFSQTKITNKTKQDDPNESSFLCVPLPCWFISSHKVLVTSIPVPFSTALGSCLERLLTPRVGFRRPASKSVGRGNCLQNTSSYTQGQKRWRTAPLYRFFVGPVLPLGDSAMYFLTMG